MFIDLHAHAQRVEGAPRIGMKPWASAGELVARYDELDIEKGVVQPLIGPEFYEPQSNQDVLEMADTYPDRIIPFCSVHPKGVRNSPDSDFRPLLRYYKERGCKGVGEIIANMALLDPMVQNLFSQIADVELPVTIHVGHQFGGNYGLVDEAGLPGFERTLQCFPKLNLLAHAPAFWSEIGKLETPADRGGYPRYSFTEEGVVPTLFRRYDNLYGDLSAGSGYNALARNPEYAVQFLTEFQDQLLFATDICAPDTEVKLVPFLLDLRKDGKISEEVFQKIARENAIKLLGLGDS